MRVVHKVQRWLTYFRKPKVFNLIQSHCVHSRDRKEITAITTAYHLQALSLLKMNKNDQLHTETAQKGSMINETVVR